MKFLFINIALILLGYWHISIAASNKIDTLEKKILNSNKKKLSDQEKAREYNKISNIYLAYSPENALKYAQTALKYAVHTNDKKQIANAYNNIGNVYYYWGNLDRALLFYKKSYIIAKKLKNDYLIAKSLGSIGNVFYQWGNYKKSLEYYQQTLELFEKNNKKREMAITYNNIGNVYTAWDKLSRAVKYYYKSLRITEELKDEIGIARTLNNIGYIFEKWADYQKSLEYFNNSLKICQKIKNNKGIILALENIANVYKNQGEYIKAFELYQKALKLSRKMKNKKGEANSLNNLGRIYFDWGHYGKAIEYYHNSLKIRKQTGNQKGIAEALINIGNIYLYIKNYQEALEFYKKALAIYRKLENTKGIALSYNNIGNVFANLKKYDKALDYYQKSLQLEEQLENKIGIARTLNNIGKIFEKWKQYYKALEYYEKTLRISEGLNNKYSIALTLSCLGDIYKDFGKASNTKTQANKLYQQAMNYYNKSLQIAKSINLRERIMNNYRSMAIVDSLLGDFKNSLKNFKLYTAWKDSIFNYKNSKQIARMQAVFEIEKAQQQIEILKNENKIKELVIMQNKYLIYGLSATVALILFIAILFIQHNKLKSKQKSIDLEQKLLRSQMNPHFIFNSLIAIQNFINKNNKKVANKYLSDFSRLMRLILENSKEEYISLKKEITTLQYYIELQKLRFKDKFDYNIFIDPEINTESIAIPPMLAQPFIENSIEHGFNQKKNKGFIDIRFYLKNNYILFEVQDNGIGREQALKYHTHKHKSMATTITNERLINLNRKSKKKIYLNISDIKDNSDNICGTKVQFNIPYRFI